MTIHIFNPEHDIALASGLSNFTAPHAGRQLRHDLGFLPAVWAHDGDIILVDDAVQAKREWQRLTHRLSVLQMTESLPRLNLQFTPTKPSVYSEQTSSPIKAINPWGWNSALRAMLMRSGIREELMPTCQQLLTIRELSHRRIAAALLPKLRLTGTVGEAFECQTAEQVEALHHQYGALVLKAPWSSSGRGLRFLTKETSFQNSTYISGWLRNTVQNQGSVLVEPLYNKVKDFGMEFYADGNGLISYLGLSLFHTANGAYTGNILATESVKRKMISRYIPIKLIDDIQQRICLELAKVYNGKYQGPFGVDMMVISNSPIGQSPSFLLHPCVEINLRHTMGHVALALSPQDDELCRVMRIEYSDNNYKLIINRL